MIRAKNYETVLKFVEVMPQKMWRLLSEHGVAIFAFPETYIEQIKLMMIMVLWKLNTASRRYVHSYS